MALVFTFNSAVYTDSGTPLSEAYARLRTSLFNDEETIQIQVEMYEDLAAYYARRRRVWVDQIPTELKVLTGPITANNYNNLDMESIHNQVKNILLQGNGHPNYPAYADPYWTGLQGIDVFNLIDVVMP